MVPSTGSIVRALSLARQEAAQLPQPVQSSVLTCRRYFKPLAPLASTMVKPAGAAAWPPPRPPGRPGWRHGGRQRCTGCTAGTCCGSHWGSAGGNATLVVLGGTQRIGTVLIGQEGGHGQIVATLPVAGDHDVLHHIGQVLVHGARRPRPATRQAGTSTFTGLLIPASTAAMFMLTTFSPFLA